MQELSVQRVRKQLDLILGSNDFSASNRFRQFIKFVVEETLAGRGGRLKAYTIATQVFGRDRNFDPQLDPVVRVEAAKLRNKLEQYYLRRKGREQDDVYISIPKGCYVPKFESIPQLMKGQEESLPEELSSEEILSEETMPEEYPAGADVSAIPSQDLVNRSSPVSAPFISAPAPDAAVALADDAGSASEEHVCSALAASAPVSCQIGAELTIAILPFTNISSSCGIEHLLSGLAEELAIALTKFEDFRVISAHALSAESGAGDHNALLSSLGARFAIYGSAQLDANILRVRLKLVDTAMHITLWAEKFDEPYTATSLFEIIDTTATQVAAQIGDSFGCIKRAMFREISTQRTGSIKAFEAILYYHHWVVNLSEDRMLNVKEALDRAIEADPRYCLAHAMLADVYAVHHQWGYNFYPDALEESRRLARRAIELNPYCQYANWSNAYVCYLSRDKDQFIHLARLAVSLNSADTNILAAAGQKLAMAGNWEEGFELIHNAERLNPFLPSWFRSATFTWHLYKGELENALAEARRIFTPRIAGPLFAAAVLGAMGRRQEAEQDVQEVLKIMPAFPSMGRELLNRIFFQNSIIRLLDQGLKNAGL